MVFIVFGYKEVNLLGRGLAVDVPIRSSPVSLPHRWFRPGGSIAERLRLDYDKIGMPDFRSVLDGRLRYVCLS